MDSKNTKANSLIKKDPRKSGFPKKCFRQTDIKTNISNYRLTTGQLTYKKVVGKNGTKISGIQDIIKEVKVISRTEL